MYQKESVLHEKRYYFAYKPFFFNSDFSLYVLVTVKPTFQFTVKKAVSADKRSFIRMPTPMKSQLTLESYQSPKGPTI